MPRTRSTSADLAPALRRVTRAFETGTAAYGAPTLRPGFTFSPVTDLEFALGFPYCRYLTDEPLDDAQACALVRSAIVDVTPIVGRMAWPRAVVHRLIRALASPVVWSHHWTDAATAVVADGAPIDRDEAAALIAAMIDRVSPQPPGTADFYFLLEAMFGSELIAEAITATLETRDPIPRFADYSIFLLGFMLLRVPADVGRSLRARLEAVFARLCPSREPGPRDREEPHSPMRALDLVLHGGASARRSLMPIGHGATVDLQGLQHLVDDPAFVRQIVAQEEMPRKAMFWWPDARLVFLGGPEVTAHYLPWVSKIRPTCLDFVMDSFAPIDSEETVALFTALAAIPRSKKRATAWLARR